MVNAPLNMFGGAARVCGSGRDDLDRDREDRCLFAFAGRSRQTGTATPQAAPRRAPAPAASARAPDRRTPGLPLQPLAAPPAGAGVVQRQVEHDGSVYKGNNTRPGWRIHAENKLAKQLNAEEGTSYSGKDVNFKKHKKDRGHTVAFEAIQNWVVDYLNSGGSLDFKVLQSDARMLVAECESDERDNVDDALTALESAVGKYKAGDDAIISAANSLLSLLNSVSENLTPTSKYVNTYASYNFHPDFTATPQGTHVSATKHSKTMASLGPDKVNKTLWTPTKGEHIVGIKGRVPFKAMTPVTHQIFSKHAHETRNVKSGNVTKELTPDNPYLSSSSSSSVASTPKPKINLGSASALSSSSTSSTSSTSGPVVTNSNNNNVPSSSAVPMVTSSISSSSSTSSTSAMGPTPMVTSSAPSSSMTISSTASTSSFAPSTTSSAPVLSQQQMLFMYQQVSFQLSQAFGLMQQYKAQGFMVPPQLLNDVAILWNQFSWLKASLGL
jgi:hypothetical protein